MKVLKQLVDAASILLVMVLGFVLLTILMDVPFVSIPIQMVVIFGVHLLAGWYFFASETFTLVEFHGAFWMKSTLGLLLVSVCLDVVFRELTKRKSKGTSRWRLKWSFGISGMLMILFGIGMTIQGATAAMEWLGNGKTSGVGYYGQSASRLFDMGARHADGPQGTLPDNLADVLHRSGADTTDWMRRCAIFRSSTVWEVPEYWTWLGGVAVNGPEDVPVAFAPRLTKDGMRYVVFLNGMAEQCTEEEWQAALERWRQAMRSDVEGSITKAAR